MKQWWLIRCVAAAIALAFAGTAIAGPVVSLAHLHNTTAKPGAVAPEKPTRDFPGHSYTTIRRHIAQPLHPELDAIVILPSSLSPAERTVRHRPLPRSSTLPPCFLLREIGPRAPPAIPV